MRILINNDMSLLSDTKNLFLIYPPGTGGTHFANLLSMNPEFTPRFDTSGVYADVLFEKYKDEFSTHRRVNAHFSPILNLVGGVEYATSLLHIPSINIILSHGFEFKNNGNYFINLPKLSYILFTYPSKNSIAYERLYETPLIYGDNTNNIINYQDLYNYEYIVGKNEIDLNIVHDEQSYIRTTRYPFIPPDRCIILNSDMFFCETGCDYVNKLLLDNFEWEMDPRCNVMHKLWFDTMNQVSWKKLSMMT